MIYLIDDKIDRQKKLKWNSEFLKSFEDVLVPIYLKEDLDKFKNEIFKENNVILFHESFFDNPINFHEMDVLQIRDNLKKYSEEKSSIVVFFSGSIGSRYVENKIAYLPVQILYNNLESFCNEYRKSSESILIDKIVFGNNYLNEEILLRKNRIWNLLYDQDQNSLLKLTPVLNNEIEDIEKLLNRKLVTNDVTIEYLKYQIGKL